MFCIRLDGERKNWSCDKNEEEIESNCHPLDTIAVLLQDGISAPNQTPFVGQGSPGILPPQNDGLFHWLVVVCAIFDHVKGCAHTHSVHEHDQLRPVCHGCAGRQIVVACRARQQLVVEDVACKHRGQFSPLALVT